MTKSQLSRQSRVRKRLRSRSSRFRLSVFRSNKYFSAQIIDDTKGVTLVSAAGKRPEAVGRQIAEAAKKKQLTKVVLDRGQYQFHGQIKTFATAARSAGLDF